MQSPELKDARLLLLRSVNARDKNSIRPITVINGYPLYKSTGNNSGFSNTWFPFSGINHEALEVKNETYQMGWIIKPEWQEWDQELDITIDISPYFPKKIIDLFFEEMCSDEERAEYLCFLARFGNFDAMCISLLIGGGYWEDEGVKLKEFILKEFPKEIKVITDSYSKEIEEAKSVANINKNLSIMKTLKLKFVQDTKEDIIAVNDWLISRGSTSKLDDNGRPKINFSNKTVTQPDFDDDREIRKIEDEENDTPEIISLRKKCDELIASHKKDMRDLIYDRRISYFASTGANVQLKIDASEIGEYYKQTNAKKTAIEKIKNAPSIELARKALNENAGILSEERDKYKTRILRGILLILTGTAAYWVSDARGWGDYFTRTRSMTELNNILNPVQPKKPGQKT